MSDYLWDKTGEADREVERLEELLGAFAHRPRALELPAEAAPRPRRLSFPRLAAAAAVLLAVLAGALFALKVARTGEGGPVAESVAPAGVAPAVENPASPPALPVLDEERAEDEPPVRGGRGVEVSKRSKRRRAVPAFERVGAGPRAEVASAEERFEAKEQLVYALRLTSAKLGEVRRRVQGGPAGAGPQ